MIPFISIIEQTAGQFHDIFKTLEPNPVLEVHSNIPLENESGGEVDELADERRMKRLAGENFDAPLVVTTAVQFYESLMGNRSSQCRKLHNLTDAVIILDEVQKIPVEYIHVILTLFKELSTTYRDTVVMCTATQPALVENRYFPIGFKEPPYEMIRDPQKLYEALKRVRIVNLGKQSDEELLAHPLIYKKMEARIEEKQKHLAAFEKIKRFTLLAHPFSMESGELTDTLKLRRKVVAEHYAEAIEKMYK